MMDSSQITSLGHCSQEENEELCVPYIKTEYAKWHSVLLRLKWIGGFESVYTLGINILGDVELIEEEVEPPPEVIPEEVIVEEVIPPQPMID